MIQRQRRQKIEVRLLDDDVTARLDIRIENDRKPAARTGRASDRVARHTVTRRQRIQYIGIAVARRCCDIAT